METLFEEDDPSCPNNDRQQAQNHHQQLLNADLARVQRHCTPELDNSSSTDSRGGSVPRVISEEDEVDDDLVDAELEAYPGGGLELPPLRSPRGSIHSLYGSNNSSRRNSNCSQGSGSSTLSWSSLQALRLAAARARSTSLPHAAAATADATACLEYSLFLSEQRAAEIVPGAAQLQQTDYGYLSASPEYTFGTGLSSTLISGSNWTGNRKGKIP